jgi:hypothetical protein
VPQFASDVAANLIGTFAGAVLALLSAWGLSRSAARRNEARLVQSAIDRLSRSRVFTHTGQDRGPELSAAERDDLRRSTESVLASREYIARVIADLGLASRSVATLEEMHAACSRCLRAIEDNPAAYDREMVQLRDDLGGHAERMCRDNPRLTLRLPGETAFPRPASKQPGISEGTVQPPPEPSPPSEGRGATSRPGPQ